MEDKGYNETGGRDEIFSKVLRAGRRTYFFDVRETRAGDYYLTITESKKNQNNDGTFYYRKHKIYLYKEDFTDFLADLNETTDFIIDNKGEEVISERHQKDYTTKTLEENSESENENNSSTTEAGTEEKENLDTFTNLNFDEI